MSDPELARELRWAKALHQRPDPRKLGSALLLGLCLVGLICLLCIGAELLR